MSQCTSRYNSEHCYVDRLTQREKGPLKSEIPASWDSTAIQEINIRICGFLQMRNLKEHKKWATCFYFHWRCYPKTPHSVSVRDKQIWDKTACRRTVILEDRNRAGVKYSHETSMVTCQEEQGWAQVNEKRMRKVPAQIYWGMILFRVLWEGRYSVVKSMLPKEDRVG